MLHRYLWCDRECKRSVDAWFDIVLSAGANIMSNQGAVKMLRPQTTSLEMAYYGLRIVESDAYFYLWLFLTEKRYLSRQMHGHVELRL